MKKKGKGERRTKPPALSRTPRTLATCEANLTISIAISVSASLALSLSLSSFLEKTSSGYCNGETVREVNNVGFERERERKKTVCVGVF